jgi:protein phosphatase
LYLFREASLRQLTEDHTLVQEQIRVGMIGEEASKTHPMRHVITNSLGAKEGIRIDVGHELLELGDLLMLCTDGLHQMLPLSELEALLSSGADLAKLGAELIDRANAAGGPDNITVALIRRTE